MYGTRESRNGWCDGQTCRRRTCSSRCRPCRPHPVTRRPSRWHGVQVEGTCSNLNGRKGTAVVAFVKDLLFNSFWKLEPVSSVPSRWISFEGGSKISISLRLQIITIFRLNRTHMGEYCQPHWIMVIASSSRLLRFLWCNYSTRSGHI